MDQQILDRTGNSFLLFNIQSRIFYNSFHRAKSKMPWKDCPYKVYNAIFVTVLEDKKPEETPKPQDNATTDMDDKLKAEALKLFNGKLYFVLEIF